MADKFKVGDRVRFVEDSYHFKTGDFAEVIQCDGDGIPRGKRTSDGLESFFYDYTAERVEGFTMGQRVRITGERGIRHSFSVGQRVRFKGTSNRYGACFQAGEVVVIKTITNPTDLACHSERDGTYQCVYHDEVEAITEAPMTPKKDPLEVIKEKLAALPASYGDRSTHQDVQYDLLTGILAEAYGLRPEVRTTTTVEFVQV